MPALTIFDHATQRVIAPNPPRYDLWPASARAAWTISGALLSCGPGHRGIGWPETPKVRLAALGEWLSPQRVSTFGSAAWVWGAARHPGSPLELSMIPGTRRPFAVPDHLSIREMRATSEDIVKLGEFMVSSPFRTTIDLLHNVERFDITERIACRLLARQFTGGLEYVRSHIDAHRRPYRTLAKTRLEWITSRD